MQYQELNGENMLKITMQISTISVMSIFLIMLGLGACNGEHEIREYQVKENIEHVHSGKNIPIGLVIETMNSGGYTYALMQIANEQKWVAGPEKQISIGDKFELSGMMLMQNFSSKTLNKIFDEIYFINSFGSNSEPTNVTNQNLHEKSIVSMLDFGDIAIPENGYNVSYIVKNSQSLAKQTISLRAKIVKANTNIMNRNWYHLQDGSGEIGENDITITSNDVVKVGDLVLVTGKIAIDKDFGSGYRYKVILEESKIVIE
jgi:hypothetical protein